MKTKFSFFAAIMMVAALALGACSDDDEKVWNELPDSIAQFVDKYWPGSYVRSFEKDGNEYTVQIANGPEIDFDLQYNWVDIDGDGMPLPQMLLYDQLPPKLYEYLESGQYLNSVFELERDARQYRVELLNQDIVYTIANGAITTITSR